MSVGTAVGAAVTGDFVVLVGAAVGLLVPAAERIAAAHESTRNSCLRTQHVLRCIRTNEF